MNVDKLDGHGNIAVDKDAEIAQGALPAAILLTLAAVAFLGAWANV